MRFTKITATAAKGVELEWTTPAEKHPKTEVEHSLSSGEAPHPDFITALQGFVPEILKLLELPKGYGDELVVTSLSINYKADRLGMVVTAKKKLAGSNAPLVLHTPHLQEANDEETGGYLSDEMVRLLRVAGKHAKAYVEGARAQVELFEPAAGK